MSFANFESLDEASYSKLLDDFLHGFCRGDYDDEDLKAVETSIHCYDWSKYYIEECKDARLVFQIGEAYREKTQMPSIHALATDVTRLPPDVAAGLVTIGGVVMDCLLYGERKSQDVQNIVRQLFPKEEGRKKFLLWSTICLACMLTQKHPISEKRMQKLLKRQCGNNCLREAKRIYATLREPQRHVAHDARTTRCMKV
jgi:hypothetical protein